ncbi:Serine/threonine-protein kinase gad8 [Tolypocladium capitatum]|uniref:Serine/threonine-protein kinase gad8 n=1 Tax=Tolypocladium capitatum TaxID=45235 RepID=A0A2K3QKU8_9HYPO|nr:Serine/threonine-protein kinase gad8 [Tolypocladium capitatum]
MSGEFTEELGKAHIDDAPDVKNDSFGPTGDNCIAIQLHSHPRPGVLIVTLHQGVGFSPLDQHDSLGRYNRLKTLRHPVYQQPFLPYAILDFEKSQLSIRAVSGTAENPLWAGDEASCRFDVSRFAELTIYLYLKNAEASTGSQDTFLGLTRIHPSFDERKPLDPEWLDVQDGTGKIRVTVEYIENRTSKMANWKYLTTIGESGSDMIDQVKKANTRQLYAMKTIETADVISPSEVVRTLRTQINNPFITSLRLACRSSRWLHLFSPFVSGGHLFYYLQKERRFDVTRSTLYTAELLCALEYLHSLGIVCNRLRPRNILLDSLGHIALCDFDLFSLEVKDMMVECPAAESLIDQSYSRVADWWMLGVFLYEMLTGLPPFYDEDTDEMHRKILHEPVQFPESVPPAARDVLTELLNRKPEKRLGANGAAEIKAHAFFCDLDWDKLLQRKYEPTFKPENVAICFWESPGPPVQFSGFAYIPPKATLEDTMDRDASTKSLPPLSEPSQEATKEKEEDGWVLRWDEASQSLHFYHRFTNTKRPANVQAMNTTADGTEAYLTQQPPVIQPIVRDDPTMHGDSSPSIGSPSQSQKRDALEAALKAGYLHIVSQLMEYGMDLNIFFGGGQNCPLEWAAEHENVDLVRLFLDKGADANFPNFDILGIHQGGPALIKAVEKGNQELAEALVRKTNRVASTRALGLAIDRRDITMVRLLLANGVRCDFEEADRPHPPPPRHSDCVYGCSFRNISEPEEFIPPLVRAVKQGDVDLARLMLSHGADANVGYHDLTRKLSEIHQRSEIMFSCGRVIELAMELNQQEIVQLLLASGADIGLISPVWPVPGHDCQQVPRTVYQRVTAGLRVAAARKEGKTAAGRGS